MRGVWPDLPSFPSSVTSVALCVILRRPDAPARRELQPVLFNPAQIPKFGLLLVLVLVLRSLRVFSAAKRARFVPAYFFVTRSL